MNLLRRLLLSLFLYTGCTIFAQAHAFLDHAEPGVGSTVKASPAEIRIWFTKDLAAGSSSIAVFNAGGAEVDRKDVKIDSIDAALMIVTLPKMPAGTYKVVWNAICRRDGHHTTGTFTFSVAGPD